MVVSVWHPTGPVSHRLGNGEIRQVEVLASSILFEGLPAALVMVTDVTERLAAQAREREGRSGWSSASPIERASSNSPCASWKPFPTPFRTICATRWAR